MDPDTSPLVAAYFEYARTKDERLFWAWETVDAEGWHDPERKWPLILALLASATNDHEIGLVAAGPLEELLRMYGHDFIDRIEAEAPTNQALRLALGGVRLRGSLRPEPDVVADRVDRITATAEH